MIGVGLGVDDKVGGGRVGVREMFCKEEMIGGGSSSSLSSSLSSSSSSLASPIEDKLDGSETGVVSESIISISTFFEGGLATFDGKVRVSSIGYCWLWIVVEELFGNGSKQSWVTVGCVACRC